MANADQFRLRNNGYEFPRMSYHELRAAAVGLTQVLLLPGWNVLDQDHMNFWSWSAQVIRDPNVRLNDPVDREIDQRLSLAVEIAVARGPGTRRNRDEVRLEHLVNRLREILGAAAFPLLEAIARRACADYVDGNGKVRMPFAKGSKGKAYAVNQFCSSLGDVMRLLVSTVSSPSLRSDLEDVFAHIKQVTGEIPGNANPSGVDVLAYWRNSTLHGEAGQIGVGGTVLTLALLIALDRISDNYELHRETAQDVIRIYTTTRSWTWAHLGHYPPPR